MPVSVELSDNITYRKKSLKQYYVWVHFSCSVVILTSPPMTFTVLFTRRVPLKRCIQILTRTELFLAFIWVSCLRARILSQCQLDSSGIHSLASNDRSDMVPHTSCIVRHVSGSVCRHVEMPQTRTNVAEGNGKLSLFYVKFLANWRYCLKWNSDFLQKIHRVFD